MATLKTAQDGQPSDTAIWKQVRTRTVLQTIADYFERYWNAHQRGEKEQAADLREAVEKLVEDYMPRGSGFDVGTFLDFALSQPEKLVFNTEFHHMSERGYYTIWTEHSVVVTPSFTRGFDVRVTGRNVDGIKEYIGDTFAEALMEEITEL